MNRIRWFAVVVGVAVALAAWGAWKGWFDGAEPEPCITDTELMGSMSYAFFIAEGIQAMLDRKAGIMENDGFFAAAGDTLPYNPL